MNATDTKYISLKDAAKLVPHGTYTKLWRWARCGIACASGKRFFLRHARFGSELFTTADWIDEFTTALAEADIEARAKRAG